MIFIPKKTLLNTIRKKMLFYFLVTIFMISFVSIYTFHTSKRFTDQVDGMFVSSIMLKEVGDNLNKVDENLSSYLMTKNSDSLNGYIKYSQMLEEKINSINKYKQKDENSLILENISNLSTVYVEEASKAVTAKRGRDIEGYILAYKNAKEHKEYINMYIEKLNIKQIQDNTEKYQPLKKNIKKVQISNMIMVIDIIILSVFIIFNITYKMTKPIILLSHSAEEISKGNFTTKEIIVTSDDEIKIMIEAFNKMKLNIQNYINELKDKSETEGKLMEQKVNNLKMQSLLDAAELQALQSQINPHFLFNTLNAGVQLAMMEGADNTSIFLENLSSLFRYNIQKLNNKVRLEQEINNSKAYCELLKVRFGDLIKFNYDIDESIKNIELPPLIIQPLIENAYIHGLSDKESGGEIKVTTKREQKYGLIIVEDNGVGMEYYKVQKILKKAKQKSIYNDVSEGHTTGIGLINVIHRLQLFYNNYKVVDIFSEVNKGTKIIIKINLKDEINV